MGRRRAPTRRISAGPLVSPRSRRLKVGIVSDLHCNLEGLDLALQAMGDVDELLCLGDSIFEYRFSNEVVARLKERRRAHHPGQP